MQKSPELIAHLNKLGVADVELKNNNVVKIHFQQGVSQKTWSKKELTDICNAFIAGCEATAQRAVDNIAINSILQHGASLSYGIVPEHDLNPEDPAYKEQYKKQVADFWGTVAAKPDLEPAPVERLG